jgi:hypothetical protein
MNAPEKVTVGILRNMEILKIIIMNNKIIQKIIYNTRNKIEAIATWYGLFSLKGKPNGR